MPELPEVETIAQQLNRRLKGKEIEMVEVLREKSFVGKEKELVGKRIKKIDREAKMIWVSFVGWESVIVVHLKMTGQLVWRPENWDMGHMKREVVGGHPSEDWVKELPDKHTRVVIGFSDGSRLFFNDLRVFGWMKLVSEKEWGKIVDKLPPDVVDEDFSLKYLSEVLSGSSRAVKLVVMDSNKIGGAGNIYANDALNLARIDPRRSARELKEGEVERLYKALKKVISLGIKYGGATYSDFRDTQGLGGRYQDHFLVYKRDGRRCKNCGGKIKKTKLGGRGTYYCPDCQT